ncbi:TRAP-type C4-dicarboxylate transport system substrate-binding protein [Neobacillus niacini]|uniref:TRAP transporter substrate-binding protein n=1 Tax=Neobacillus niacini TaxID=86668 RepID=UPI00285D4DC5|nr:TRAP transporter substrate-binding protein DctP [Neobacillus niacini]MDR7075743.1 TRAP-type C4-dicarboxylate transport system substrate-binding protein [Neobacillus niacini]
MKNSKNLIIIGLLLMCMIVVTACGGKATQTVNKDKVFTLDLNIPAPDNSANSKVQYYSYKWFVEEIEKRSEGRMKINVYFNGQLAQLPELLDATASGSVDLGYVTTSFYGDLIPEAFITNMPLWAKDVNEAYDLWHNTEIGEIYNNAFKEYGVTPIMNNFVGNGGWLLNKPVHSVEDMKGLLVATFGGLFNTWLKGLGATGVDMPNADWYDGMSRGVIDGIPTSYSTLKNLKLNEVVDYVIAPPFNNALMLTMFISNKTLEELPKNLQDILLETAKEAETNALQGSNEDSEKVLKEVKEFEKAKAFEVITLSKEEEQRFYDSVQPMWDEFASLSEGNARIIEIIRENRKER